MAIATIEKQLNEILAFIDIHPTISVKEVKDTTVVDITGENLNFLIGYRGESLDALQYILCQAVYKNTAVWTPINVDINGYKKQKLEKLDEMVKNYIDRVRFHQKEMKLPPLSSYERRYIHNFLAEYVDVKSESRGEGSERRLFLLPVTTD